MTTIYIVAAAQNFSRAAETVHVSLPSLSVQIRALEEELGIRRFDRPGKEVVSTWTGEIFRGYAQRVTRELEQVPQSVQELQGTRRGRAAAGTLSTVPLASFLRSRLASSVDFPVFSFRFRAQLLSDLVAAPLANRLDPRIGLLPVVGDRLIAKGNT